MKIKITGVGNNMIEIDGDMHQAFTAFHYDGDFLAFSDGTVLFVRFDEGRWGITHITAGSAKYTHQHAEEGAVSDIAQLEGEIKWVVVGRAFEITP